MKSHLVKDVTDRGHSGGVYLPKSWVGQKVLVQPISVKEYILNALSPHMEELSGVYLYGSYARGEEDEESDIDVLVIAEKKVKEKSLGLVNIESASQEDIGRWIRTNPVQYYAIIQEAVPIINAPMLKELKSIKPDLKNLKEYYEDTDRALKICKELLGNPCDDNAGAIYSLVLRLRGLYLAKCILKGEKYSSRDFEEYVKSKGIEPALFEKIYAFYRAKREERPTPRNRIPVKHLRKLYEIASETLEELRNDKKQKTEEKH
jgi:predicted nucleotidyltransferase